MSKPLLTINNLQTHFFLDEGIVQAVNGVYLEIPSGQTLAIVGESGSGKTTVGRTILRALKPTAGEVIFQISGKSNEKLLFVIYLSKLVSKLNIYAGILMLSVEDKDNVLVLLEH